MEAPRIASNAPPEIPAARAAPKASGMTIGVRIDIVPHEVPVENDMPIDTRKTASGRNRGSRTPEST